MRDLAEGIDVRRAFSSDVHTMPQEEGGGEVRCHAVTKEGQMEQMNTGDRLGDRVSGITTACRLIPDSGQNAC
jgi:hypothetical protein